MEINRTEKWAGITHERQPFTSFNHKGICAPATATRLFGLLNSITFLRMLQFTSFLYSHFESHYFHYLRKFECVCVSGYDISYKERTVCLWWIVIRQIICFCHQTGKRKFRSSIILSAVHSSGSHIANALTYTRPEYWDNKYSAAHWKKRRKKENENLKKIFETSIIRLVLFLFTYLLGMLVARFHRSPAPFR